MDTKKKNIMNDLFYLHIVQGFPITRYRYAFSFNLMILIN